MPSASFCLLHVFVLQKIHIKRSPNAIKFHGELFCNICDFWELESPQTEAHTAHLAHLHYPPRTARNPLKTPTLATPAIKGSPTLSNYGTLVLLLEELLPKRFIIFAYNFLEKMGHKNLSRKLHKIDSDYS